MSASVAVFEPTHSTGCFLEIAVRFDLNSSWPTSGLISTSEYAYGNHPGQNDEFTLSFPAAVYSSLPKLTRRCFTPPVAFCGLRKDTCNPEDTILWMSLHTHSLCIFSFVVSFWRSAGSPANLARLSRSSHDSSLNEPYRIQWTNPLLIIHNQWPGRMFGRSVFGIKMNISGNKECP